MVAAALDASRGAAALAAGDEVFVPAVCWSTSVAPLLQLGLAPVFVDVDPATFNISLPALEAACAAHPRARGLMAVHVLGNSSPMGPLLALARERSLVLLEDTCESLGSRAVLPGGGRPGAMLGTFGAFGAFSFYFSHHITCGEGGMVVCQNEDDYNRLRRLRAHGWTRHLTNRAEVEARHADIDPRFCFVSVGYNVRPMEVQGAMLRVQLRKLEPFNACRRDNYARIEAALTRDARFAEPRQMTIDPEGRLYVTEPGNHKLRRLTCIACPATFYCAPGAPVTCPMPIDQLHAVEVMIARILSVMA
jgi:CDP-6-deoxy-D-xylo-4-hexulose-3-dehydrase